MLLIEVSGGELLYAFAASESGTEKEHLHYCAEHIMEFYASLYQGWTLLGAPYRKSHENRRDQSRRTSRDYRETSGEILRQW